MYERKLCFTTLARFHVPLQHSVIDHAYRGILLKRFRNPSKLSREKQVVGVKQCDNLAASLFKSRIQRCRLAAIRLNKVPNPRAILSYSRIGVVSRAIIDDDNFRILLRELLRQYAINRLLNEPPIVICRDQNG